MESNKILSSKVFKVVMGLLLVSMLIGSVFDYQVSSRFYNSESLFGLFLAAYGQLPSALAMSIGGGLWIYTAIKYKGISNVIRAIVGMLLIAFGVFMGFYEPADYLVSAPKVLLFIISILLNGFAIFGSIKLVSRYGEMEMRKLALFLVFFVASQIIIVNIIKVPWARPRMRFLELYPEVEFAPWWQIGSSIKDKYLGLGVGSNEFKSFPSGHTASSLNILFMAVFARYSKGIAKNINRILIIGLVFGLLTALSRIVLGAHFLTDVTVGYTITFVLYLVSLEIFFKNSTKTS